MGYKRSAIPVHHSTYDNTMIAKIYHNELAKYVEYVKAENKILRARITTDSRRT